MPDLDYELARRLLEESFVEAERALADDNPPVTTSEVSEACEALFESKTQAFREVLIGCVLARLLDPHCDITLPYVNLGPLAFNGRSLDEQVVNPFIHAHSVPCSRGPYLSVFRRSVAFDPSTRKGVRDPRAYDALLQTLGLLRRMKTDDAIRGLLRYLLFRFVRLRESSRIELARPQRVSLPQYARLVERLLAQPSGGRWPVLLVAATLATIQRHFALDWIIACQEINVADRASGASGDVTVTSKGRVVFAAEVTERRVDEARIIATFRTKLLPAGVEDYLFLMTGPQADDAAIQRAQDYFAQGHEVNFLVIREWMLMVLATIGSRGRRVFLEELVSRIDGPGVTTQMRISWNEQVARLPDGR